MQQKQETQYIKLSSDIVDAELDLGIFPRDVSEKQIEDTKKEMARMVLRGIEMGISMTDQNHVFHDVDIQNIDAYLDGYKAGLEQGYESEDN